MKWGTTVVTANTKKEFKSTDVQNFINDCENSFPLVNLCVNLSL